MRQKGIKQRLLAGREKMFSQQGNFSLRSLILVVVLLISGAVSASDQPPAGVKVIEAPDVKVGDSWIYNYKEGPSLRMAQEDGRRIFVVESITDNEIIFAVTRGEGGAYWRETNDKQLNIISRPDRRPGHQFRKYTPHNSRFSFPLWEGKKWKAKYKVESAIWQGDYEVKGRATGWEKVTVPAGTFDALKIVNKIEWSGRRTDLFRDYSGEAENIYWYAPEVKRFVKSTWESLEGRAEWDSLRRAQRGWTRGTSFELVEYKLK